MRESWGRSKSFGYPITKRMGFKKRGKEVYLTRKMKGERIWPEPTNVPQHVAR